MGFMVMDDNGGGIGGCGLESMMGGRGSGVREQKVDRKER